VTRYIVQEIVTAAQEIAARGEPVTREAIADQLGVGTAEVDQSVTNARQAGALGVVLLVLGSRPGTG